MDKGEIMITEIIGFSGSLFVLISMLFNTDSTKGAICLRCLNNVGSILFIWYAIRLNAPSMLVLNGIVFVVNTIYLVKLIRNKSKKAR